MNKLIHITALLLILALFAMPILAQDSELPPAELPAWANILPTALTVLVLTNFKTTEAFRRMLLSKNFGYTPPQDVAGVITLAFSALFGMFLAWITPHATDWLIPLDLHPALAIAFTGMSISTLGGVVYEFMKRLGGGTVYKTTTEISSPSDNSPAPAATMQAVAEAAKG